jgi:hypothetical protein
MSNMPGAVSNTPRDREKQERRIVLACESAATVGSICVVCMCAHVHGIPCLECVSGWGKERFCEAPSLMMVRVRIWSAVRVSMALTHLTLLFLRSRDVLDTFER